MAPVGATPTDNVGKDVLGPSTLFVGGDLAVKGKSWSFKGKIVGGYDYYDFNRTWGRDMGYARDTDKELATWGAAILGGGLSALPGVDDTNYYIFLEGEIPLNGSGRFE